VYLQQNFKFRGKLAQSASFYWIFLFTSNFFPGFFTGLAYSGHTEVIRYGGVGAIGNKIYLYKKENRKEKQKITIFCFSFH